jgi:hypothetical protein
MRVDNPPQEQLASYYSALDRRAASAGPPLVRYLDLGIRVVRLMVHSKGYIPHIEKQLAYVLRDRADRFDTTLVVWHERELDALGAKIDERIAPLPPENDLWVFDRAYSPHHALIGLDINPWARLVYACNPETNTYYYGTESIDPEDVIKQGHLFVQLFSKMLKSPRSSLVHGAVIGLNGKGILFCARGQRGKSTLAVRAMLDGFDYVSDDYLILSREEDGLYARPIYSIITLSPMMYGDLYTIFDGKFVSNNARRDKYVFNIEKYHNRFAQRYPVSLCMYTQIVSDPEPSVAACTRMGKGRAAAQLIHSTISQMNDHHNTADIKKLIDFVKDFPFYQINLCRDIEKNLRCLREFLETGKCGQQKNTPGMLSSYAV